MTRPKYLRECPNDGVALAPLGDYDLSCPSCGYLIVGGVIPRPKPERRCLSDLGGPGGRCDGSRGHHDDHHNSAGERWRFSWEKNTANAQNSQQGEKP